MRGSGSVRSARLAFVLLLAVAAEARAQVIISEFRIRGTAGGNDEYVELFNPTSAAIDLGGWALWGSAATSTSGSSRIAIATGKSIAARGYYLLTNTASSGYSGNVTGDTTYSTGISDGGGLALLNKTLVIQDQIGLGTGTFYKEGTPIAGSATETRSYRRKAVACVGYQDTGSNVADFELVTFGAHNIASGPYVAGACSDGNACTTGDACVGTTCVGTAVVTNDDNPCTTDACNPTTGAVTHVVSEGASCDDHDACTSNDTCAANGSCAGLETNTDDGNACTDDLCDPATGETIHVDNVEPCDDGDACTEFDACTAGTCEGLALEVDDGDACTADACDPITGVSHTPMNGACDDGDACTTGDTCVAGTCEGAPVVVDDGNVCTDDACDPATGLLVHAPNVAPCNDLDLCTVADTCSAGRCKGLPKDVDDGNTCTDDTCDPVSGEPRHLSNTATCDDENGCTTGDRCASGTCAGAPIDVEDGNACTEDSCDPLTGLTSHGPGHDGDACDDHSLCTTGDFCAEGTCGGTPKPPQSDDNPCTEDACDPATGLTTHVGTAGLTCEDGNLCTLNDRCAADGSCHAGNAKNTNDGNACTDDLCDPATGTATHVNNTATCNDANPCTEADRCAAGTCAGTPVAVDDGNACTDDSCAPATGVHHAPDTTGRSCNDGSPCTQGDSCEADTCVGTPVVPDDDDDPCTADACDAVTGLTTHTPTTGNTCDDADRCTVNDRCAAGTCRGQAKDVNDGNVCTTDSCDPSTGEAKHDPNTVRCDDTDTCTANDTCRDGTCAGAPIDVDDHNDCTADLCDPVTGVSHAPTAGTCNDGDPCTEHDSCAAGACAGTPIDVDDDNACTDDTCDPISGQPRHAANTAGCDDGNACTTADTCRAGSCGGQPKTVDDGNTCTADACDPATGVISHAPKAGSCDDGDLCTVADACVEGACHGAPKDVDDDNPCTDDACAAASGEPTHSPNDIACDDGSACTEDDRCSAGACGGTPVDIDDGNECTDDACDPASGDVQHLAATEARECSDGDPCTVQDACAEDTCQGTPKDVADDDACTLDTCDATTGDAIHEVDTGATCDDDDLCTEDDTCVISGACEGTPKFVEDGNPCTTDTCDPANGAPVHVDNTSACDDENLCTRGDACTAGVCAGSAVVVDDAQECTVDACDPASGDITHAPRTGSCDDANPCTLSDACAQGACVGTPKNVNDDNPCTDDTCNAQTGAATHVANTASCDDHDLCTTTDTCAAGRCAGTPKVTTDQNPCTTDACDAASGTVTHLPVQGSVSCSDDNACTSGDACVSGTCRGTTIAIDDTNGCTADACDPVTGVSHVARTGATCDDGNPCTTIDACSADGRCVGATPKTCATPPGACYAAVGTCNPADGSCAYAFLAANTGCNDADACTTTDVCDGAGHCLGTRKACTPPAPACVDGLARTYSGGTCGTDGNCSFAHEDTSCEFGCDQESGRCKGDPCIGVTCEDPPSVCHEEAGTCVDGECEYALLAKGTTCDDHDPCTLADACGAEGACLGAAVECRTPPPATCADATHLTTWGATGTCSIVGDCSYTSTLETCATGCDADAGACREDPCKGVTCTTPPAGGCYVATGTCTNGTCSYAPSDEGSACDDGLTCTANDQCDGTGQCQGTPTGRVDTDGDGSPNVCDEDDDDDGVPDTTDSCPLVPNANQVDTDQDGRGDACEDVSEDTDRDGVVNAVDNCPALANPDQADADGDRVGDACDEPPETGCACDSVSAGLFVGIGLLARRRRARLAA